jgi:hypothetical protein
LETLPETHSLALKATETNICKGEGSESNGRLYETSALLPTIEDKYQIQHSKRSISSSGHISVQDIMPGVSSTDDLTRSESSRLNNQTGGSSQDAPVGDEENRRISTIPSLKLGAINPFENPGTPLGLFPGWQIQLGSPVGSHTNLGSPGFDKGIGSRSPASLADHLSRGIPFQHRFLSGPLHSPRPPPSKWDDAEKWIVSPIHHESSAQPQLQQRCHQLFQTGL